MSSYSFKTDIHPLRIFPVDVSGEKEKIFWLHPHTYTHLYTVLCILQLWKHVRPHLISKPEHKLNVLPERQISHQTKSICSFPPHTFFTAVTASKLGFFLLWKRTSAGTFHRGAPSPNPPDAQPPLPAFFRVSLAFISFHNDQLPLFHLYVKTNPDYLKYPTYNSPLLCSIPFDSRLTHIAFGPIGVRLWGALKPPSSYLLSSSNPGSLETAASVIAFFFFLSFFSGSPMRTGHPPIRGLFTFCDWQYSGTVPANHHLQNNEGGSFVNI